MQVYQVMLTYWHRLSLKSLRISLICTLGIIKLWTQTNSTYHSRLLIAFYVDIALVKSKINLESKLFPPSSNSKIGTFLKKAWLLCAVMGLKVFPAPRYHLFVMKMASSTYFFVLNSKMALKNTLGHSLLTQNALSRLYPVYQFWQVSKMECTKQGVFLSF